MGDSVLVLGRTSVGDTHWSSDTTWGGKTRLTVCFDVVGPADMFSLRQKIHFDEHEWVVKDAVSKPLTYDGNMRSWTITAVRETS